MDELRTVFLIDDHQDSREFVCEFLKMEGYAVRSAGNGREALAMLRELPRPALILADLIMPEMDGLTFVNALKMDPNLATIPLLVLSGSHRDAVASELPFLLKPIDPMLLVREVRTRCGPPM